MKQGFKDGLVMLVASENRENTSEFELDSMRIGKYAFQKTCIL
jgi:hypothetical protein